MKWSTHFIVGATAGLIIAKYTGMDYMLTGLAGAFFGVLPDADIILDSLGIGGHRGVYSHSLGSSAALGVLTLIGAHHIFYLPIKESMYFGSLAFLSSFLHIVTDSMSYSGVRLFWPISGKKYRGFMKHDNIAANLLIILLCALILYHLDILRGF